MCLREITRHLESVENISYVNPRIGYKVFYKDIDGVYHSPLIGGGPSFKMGQYASTKGFFNYRPLYYGGFHVFDSLIDAERYFIGDSSHVCKVECLSVVAEGKQAIHTNNSILDARCFCCLSLRIVAEIGVTNV